MKPDRAKASSLVRTTGMPMAPAAGLVVPHGHQPAGHAPVAPQPDHQHREDQHAEREPGEGPLRRQADPEQVGPGDQGGLRVGQPGADSLVDKGSVQHGVASTDPCIHRAKARVLTAR